MALTEVQARPLVPRLLDERSDMAVECAVGDHHSTALDGKLPGPKARYGRSCLRLPAEAQLVKQYALVRPYHREVTELGRREIAKQVYREFREQTATRMMP